MIKKNIRHNSRGFSRSRLLAGVGTAMILALTAQPARAADAIQFIGGGNFGTVTGDFFFLIPTPNNGNILAQVLGDETITVLGPPPESLFSNFIDNETLTATAGANVITHNPPALTLFVDNDLASLTIAQNTGSVLADAIDVDFTIDIDAQPSGLASVDDNSIVANATVNSTDANISVDLGPSQSSPLVGDTFFWDLGTPGNGWYEVEATVASLNIQENSGEGHARANGGSLSVNVDNETSAVPHVAPLEVDRNTVSANYTGNNESTDLTINDGGAPVFTGSAAAMSFQYNGAGTHIDEIQGEINNQTIRASVVSNNPATLDGAFAGDLSVSDNEVSTSATGNSAANALSLEGSTGLDGNNTVHDNDAYFAPGNILLDVEADLSVTTVQANVGGGTLDASTNIVLIQGLVESADDAALEITGNEVSSTARGNVATGAITNGEGATSVQGSAAVMNFQQNSAGAAANGVSATTNSVNILANVGDGLGVVDLFTGTVVNLSDNDVLSSALGNNSAQLIDLEANALDIGTTAAELSLDLTGVFGIPELISDGGATITNAQFNTGSAVTASTTDSTIRVRSNLGGGGVDDSTINVNGNVQEAVAGGNSADNTLNLAGNAVGVGAGINSGQLNDGASPITATFTGDPSVIVTNNVTGSTINVDGNLQHAIAFGNDVDNAVSVTANTVVAGTTAVVASSIDTDETTTTANYGLQNIQGQTSTVTASASSATALLSIDIDGFVEDSTLGIDNNAVGAGAFGNDAANTLALDVNTLTVTGGLYGNLAAISNGQYLNNDVTATVQPAGNAVNISVGGHVDPSTVTADGNTFEALAVGSRVTDNDLTVNGNIVTAEAAGTLGSVDNSAPIVAAAALVVQNVQLNEGGTTSAAVGAAAAAADITIDLGDDLDDVVVSADENNVSASATSQSASSALTIDEVNLLTATAAIQNYQESDGGASAIAGGQNAGIRIEVGTLTANAVDTSTLSISDNKRSATAVGNNAGTALHVTANTITASGNNATAESNGNVATGEFTLGNFQLVVNGVTASSLAALVIDVFDTDETDVGASSIAIAGNSQSAAAIGNLGNNDLSVDATNFVNGDGETVNTALQSVQLGDDANVGASSLLTIQAPVQVTGSTVNLSDNSNVALAVINDVDNDSSVSTTNLDGSAPGATGSMNVLTPVVPTIESDHVLNSIQDATGGGSLAATATTTISNLDAGNPGTLNSSISADGNETAVEATANRASNSLTLDGGATLSASGGLANYQNSDTNVDATATTSVSLTFGGATGDALENSTASVDDNTTTALGRGNAAENVLNYSGGIVSPTPAAATANLSGTGTITGTANALLLNGQNNQGEVDVTASMPVTLALNGIGGNSAAIASTVGASGNVINAVGYGNYAVNKLTVNGLVTTGAGVGVVSHQVNSGNVTVTASAPMSITATGGVTTSSLGFSGNTVSATAIGNSVTTTISN